MTELEKMLNGKIYNCMDPEVKGLRYKADSLVHEFNQLDLYHQEKRAELLRKLFPDAGKHLLIRGPIFVDYGINTHFGKDVYANFNFTILDVCPVYIGSRTLFGPNVSILTAMHPLVAEERRCYKHKDDTYTDDEYAKPIHIGDDCWFGGSVTVLPGVTIGDRCVIGAGSVVTHDIPSDSLAYGNPCRVIRKIIKEDSIHLKPELWAE